MSEPLALLSILVALCICALVAQRSQLAPPAAFLFGGLGLAMVPGIDIKIEPEYMLIIFLPPILMEAAFFTSIRDFRRNLRAIILMAVGLVLVTAVAVGGMMMWLIPGTTWAMGMLLGAIVSPPDAAAATAALKNVHIPRRVMTILEGESLVNDASGLILYKFALVAVMTASFSWYDASIQFVLSILGDSAIGFVLGYGFVKLFPYLRDQSVGILTTFVPPYGAYLIAESLHLSGVLAVVVAGLVVGWHAPSIFHSKFRIPAEAVWKMVVFFMNALVFLLIGIQLPDLMTRLDEYPLHMLLIMSFTICMVTILIRFIYVYGMTFGARRIFPRLNRRGPLPAWQNLFIISWTGLRGVVTLATALALPYHLPNGEPFPYRDIIIFLAVSVIIFTLVVQGISLPWLLKRLNLRFDPGLMYEEWLARSHATKQALSVLAELEKDSTVHKPALDRIRAHYHERLESLGDGPNTPLEPTERGEMTNHPVIQAENRIWQEVLKQERDIVVNLRRQFFISDDVMHDILREMDLLASRFHHTA
ncbi:MAG: Na+/H+ antiporter [Alphaproteobacteria bacterium]|nr:Na+/H+ antiporter [Alphaproteobacteria bacterium]